MSKPMTKENILVFKPTEIWELWYPLCNALGLCPWWPTEGALGCFHKSEAFTLKPLGFLLPITLLPCLCPFTLQHAICPSSCLHHLHFFWIRVVGLTRKAEFSYRVRKCWHNVFSDSRVSGHWHGCAANVLPCHENVNSHNCIFIINQRYM